MSTEYSSGKINIDPICSHNVNRALQRCRLCEPDYMLQHVPENTLQLAKLDQIIKLLETLCNK